MRIDSFKTIWKSFGIEENPRKLDTQAKMDDETMQKLLRMKRHETPSPEYFGAFLREFHQRQRRELLKTSSLGILFERVNTYLSDPRSQAWAYAPVLALFMTAFYVIIGMTGESSLPEVPSLADVEMFTMEYASNTAGMDHGLSSQWRGPFTPMHTVNVPPTPIQAAAIVSPKLRLSISQDELVRLISD